MFLFHEGTQSVYSVKCSIYLISFTLPIIPSQILGCSYVWIHFMKTKKARFSFLSLSQPLRRYQEVKGDKMPFIHARLFQKLKSGIVLHRYGHHPRWIPPIRLLSNVVGLVLDLKWQMLFLNGLRQFTGRFDAFSIN